jgi:16S rRNA (adenine1518-N6/adenine1519-N6)-dimethyltransferase
VPVADGARFRAVVRAAFAQRRKTVANALSAGFGLSTDRVRGALAGVVIDPTRRAETLTIHEFAALASRI